MDTSYRNILREYETESSLWVRAVVLPGVFLAVLETARRSLAAGVPRESVMLRLILVAVAGLGLAWFLSFAVRRSSRPGELWRKFGLSQRLLDAVAGVHHLSETAEEELDQALLSLRSMAAVANQDDWDECPTDHPTGAVDLAEQALAQHLEAEPELSAEQFAPLVELLTTASDNLTGTLAALRHDDAEEVALRWADFAAAREALRDRVSG